MLTNSWLPLQTCISLLNIDQQILSQSNAKIGPNIITPDQTGFITERQLAEKVRQMINIIEYWNKINTVTLILTLDTEKKTFDRVFRQFIFKIVNVLFLQQIYWLVEGFV